ncbi:MAG: flavin monoamine oxidase family protein [Gammaproteobacteria bacterium]
MPANRNGLNRRGFIAAGTALGSASLLGSSTAPAFAKGRDGATEIDVAIVGGGFAGATAARELGKAGYNVALLEARWRLGGRTWSSKFAGEDVELGGAWVHWLQPHVWSEMERYGLGVVEDPFTGLDSTRVMANDGTVHNVPPDQFLTDIRDGFQKFCHDVWEVFPRPYEPLHNPKILELDKLSCADRIAELELSATQRIQLNSFMTLYGGEVTHKFGLPGMLKIYAAGGWNYDAFADAESHYRIEGGTLALINHLVEDSGCDVRFNQVVTAIEHGPNGVQLTTHSGQRLSARAAVLTLPLNCYRDVSFSPALPTRKQQWLKEGMISKGAKLYIHLKENLGRIFAFCDEARPFNWVQTHKYGDDFGTLLSITVARAETIDFGDPAAIAAEIRQLLGQVTVIATSGYDWTADPYARGAWPAYGVGQLSRLPDLQRPEGALFFAGSITANGWHEFIDGAVESGLRAGREVQAFLGA